LNGNVHIFYILYVRWWAWQILYNFHITMTRQKARCLHFCQLFQVNYMKISNDSPKSVSKHWHLFMALTN
jgi:hypothetical protein